MELNLEAEVDRSGVQDQPGQHSETLSLQKLQKLAGHGVGVVCLQAQLLGKLRQENRLNLGGGSSKGPTWNSPRRRAVQYHPGCVFPKEATTVQTGSSSFTEKRANYTQSSNKAIASPRIEVHEWHQEFNKRASTAHGKPEKRCCAMPFELGTCWIQGKGVSPYKACESKLTSKNEQVLLQVSGLQEKNWASEKSRNLPEFVINSSGFRSMSSDSTFSALFTSICSEVLYTQHPKMPTSQDHCARDIRNPRHRPGAVTHACDPSTLGGQGSQIT
ncbi:hypothetical protein AAY473_006740 [Plecturocebus cupreus]